MLGVCERALALSVERGMPFGRRVGAFIGSGRLAIVGTHGAVEFPHAPPVRAAAGAGRGGSRANRACAP